MSQGNWGGGGGYGGGYAGYGPPPGGRQEVPFFTDNVVTITNARAIILGTTYALANITSVRSWSVPKPAFPLLLGILCLLAGVAIALAGGGACGGVILLVGVVATVWYFASKDQHYVRIGTAGGEVNALQSTDPAYIDQVVTALNNAIIHRG
jgi:hypothetical protein